MHLGLPKTLDFIRRPSPRRLLESTGVIERRGPRVCVVGSRALPGTAALPFLTFILNLNEPTLLLRARRSGPSNNQFEFACHVMARTLDIPVELFVPDAGGRSSTFFRDIKMVSKADVVICVFPGEQPMEGGTAHVVEKAQDDRVPVYAYTYDPDTGHWGRLGEWDPDNAWGERVPAG